MKTDPVSTSQGMNVLRRGLLERGFWHGFVMGVGAIGCLGDSPDMPLSYPKNAIAHDLQRIGNDMYAGVRRFNEKTEA